MDKKKPKRKLKTILGRGTWTRRPTTQVQPNLKKRDEKKRCRGKTDNE